jgi:hypothetical protein
MSRDTWRRQSPPMPGAGSGFVGLDLSLVCRGTQSVGYRQSPSVARLESTASWTQMTAMEVGIHPGRANRKVLQELLILLLMQHKPDGGR